jgi:hypothetical protein
MFASNDYGYDALHVTLVPERKDVMNYSSTALGIDISLCVILSYVVRDGQDVVPTWCDLSSFTRVNTVFNA